MLNSPQELSTESRRTLEGLIQQVRLFMRDYPSVNRLLKGEESSDRAIAWALMDACSEWSATPPLLGNVSPSSHPAPHLLIRCATATLLQSVSFLQTRNNLSYSDGEVSINSSSRSPELTQQAAMLMQSYESQKQRLKIAQNIEGGWGTGLHSDLLGANAYYLNY